jgi:hypothetical protein
MKTIWGWVKHRVGHKLEHLTRAHLVELLKKHGLAFMIIVVAWEIIEDILFPVFFGFLGRHLHKAFYLAVPVGWLMCLHWLVVPLLWKMWTGLKKDSPTPPELH